MSGSKKRTMRMHTDGMALLLQSLRQQQPPEPKSPKTDHNLSPTTSSATENEDPIKAVEDSTISNGVSKESIEITSEIVEKPKKERVKLDFGNEPRPLCSITAEFESERTENNYLKGCKWSPSGEYLVTNSEDKVLRSFKFSEVESEDTKALSMASRVGHGDLVYDYCWMPDANSEQELFASTSRDHPVHLWNATDGSCRATYRPMNHLDELSSAHSLCFSLDGGKIYCGFNKVIRCFDTGRSGKEHTVIPTSTKDLPGQTGIISCIAVCPTFPQTFAASSYGRTIGVYCTRSRKLQCMFHGHQGGITHIAFSDDGNLLYSGARKDGQIICWDMRFPGQELCSFERNVNTNQRVYFDLDSYSRFLVSGTSDGLVKIWDLNTLPQRDANTNAESGPLVSFAAHRSTANGVSLNPCRPLLATSGGQRIFPCPLDSEGESDTEDYERTRTTQRLDNSLKLWKFD